MRKILVRRALLTLVIFTVSVCLSACGSGRPSGPVERAWTEDVLLDDGTTITVKRYVAFNESDALSGGAYNAVESKATISFTSDLASLPSWDQPLMALVMYFDNEAKEWVIVANSSSCDVWARRGKPKPPYWEFRLNKSGWSETPLSPSSIGKSANLLHRYQSELKTKHITFVERKRLENDPMMVEEYRKIVDSVEPRYCNM